MRKRVRLPALLLLLSLCPGLAGQEERKHQPILPHPSYENTFQMMALHVKDTDAPLADLKMFRDGFGGPPPGPYARTGYMGYCYYEGDTEHADFDFHYRTHGTVLDRQLLVLDTVRCPFVMTFAGGQGTPLNEEGYPLSYWLTNTSRDWLMGGPEGPFTRRDSALMPNRSLSRYNSVVLNYKTRNLAEAVTRLVKWAYEEGKEYRRELLRGICQEAENTTPFPLFTFSEPLILLEYEDWKNGTGIYTPGALSAPLWHHPKFTGVTDVLYDPDGSAGGPFPIGTGEYFFRGAGTGTGGAYRDFGVIVFRASTVARRSMDENEDVGYKV
ncbi:MAG: hypothetical protein ACYTAF_13690, partial [Planctomycetota bacterium]